MQFVVLAVLVAALGLAVTALPGHYGGSGSSNIYHQQQLNHKGYAGPYRFGYTVEDPHTGDYHGRHESGDGAGGVRGSYHLTEPTGSIRHVDYVADYNGFRVTVNGIPHGYSKDSY